jgi:hypothetical protein
MKKILLLVVFAILGTVTWYFFVTRKKPKDETPKPQPIAVSTHSDSFNVSVNKALANYYALTEDFVNWNAPAINAKAGDLKTSLDQVNMNELKKDTPIYETAVSYVDAAKAELDNMKQAADITGKRRSLHSLTQNMYDLLRTIRYDGAKIYLQECPMAFNDEEPGDWLSQSDAVRNPYLGLHHPKYKSGMIECGSTKDTLNFISSTP